MAVTGIALLYIYQIIYKTLSMILSVRMTFGCYNQRILLMGKPEGKRPLGRPRRGWVDNIKKNLKEIGWDCVNWIGLAQDRDNWRPLVNAVINLRVP
jgi:hypothetical protein